MHHRTYQASKGTKFFYSSVFCSSNFSGEICISYSYPADEDAVHVEDMCLPASDLLEFAALLIQIKERVDPK